MYGGSKVSFITFQNFGLFELAMQDSHPSLFCTKTWYYLYISDPFWWSIKMLTASSNLFWNTQKSKWTIFLTVKVICGLRLQMF